ncbi:Peptidase S8, subtilisin-related [Trema orientale]|uniref:Peptidase S8, subtilisin-related n=1 Tax=Trema orientale TaxID=63057 RepID=A0A2P5CSR5_TREOI|nr:Peptidase S8, subtilisin-related [Trema orientale]
MVHVYRNVITGFAARLTLEEVKTMKRKAGVVFVTPENPLLLHTTRSPHFLGLSQTDVGPWKGSNFGEAPIIGVVDNGITPGHPSFSDEGMPPLFVTSQETGLVLPLDEDGHGTQTSSIAAVNFVKGANVLGHANGTAAGMAPLAHLAIYKACTQGACPESAALAPIDAAIEDGVYVLSLPFSSFPMKSFLQDPMQIAAFRAIQGGIFVTCSAGNVGPFNGSVSGPSPWVLTVGASTIDRRFRANARLGNRREYNGASLFQPTNFKSKLLPLVYPANDTTSPAFCEPQTLQRFDLKGKIVLCQGTGGAPGVSRGEAVKQAGAAAMIAVNEEFDSFSTIADLHVLPATQLSYTDGSKIKAYVNATRTPMATISFRGTKAGHSFSAPMVLSLSSRGPNLASPGILKPDILGPGVNILAAWPFPVGKTTDARSSFHVSTGTSMACPHSSGVAALLKSSHPDWSPDAVKSAIMTTADTQNRKLKPILDYTSSPANLFATGAGNVNPSRPNDPGLVHRGTSYNSAQGEVFGGEENSGSSAKVPVVSIVFGPSPQSFTRTVTNVGPANSSYRVQVVSPPGVGLRVMPDVISFTEKKQRATYNVSFSLENDSGNGGQLSGQGFLRWVSSEHSDSRSPISVMFN